MGQRTRHFIALMKKNWIVWKRSLGASLCELFCPIVLMAILAIARALVDNTNVGASSNIGSSVIMIPAINYTGVNFTTEQAAQIKELEGFANFSHLNVTLNMPYLKFLPLHCREDNGNDSSPIIAYAGVSAYTDPLVKDISQLFSFQKIAIALMESQMTTPTTKQEKMYQALFNQVKTIKDIDWQYKRFDSYQDIIEYIGGSSYMMDDDHPGVCFGFSIEEEKNDNLEVRLMFNDQLRDNDARSIPSQILDVWGEYQTDQDTASFQRYTTYGYSYIQNWAMNHILRVKTNVTNATIATTFVPFKTDAYIKDDFSQVLSSMLPFFMLLIYILPVYRLISNIVSEKESKARESMKMMGLKDFSYWLSWFTYYFIIVTLISIMCIIVLSGNVIKYSNKGIIFLFFWIYGISLFGFCIFLQSFFSRSRVAGITGTLVYFGTSFINVAVTDSSVSSGQKNLASLLSTVAVSLGSVIFGNFETAGKGLTGENINDMYNNYRFSGCLIMMVIGMNLFMWIGFWLDNVLPSAYGLRKHLCFCFLPSYWFGTEEKKKVKTQVHQKNDTFDNENVSSDQLFETKYIKPKNFEPPPKELSRQEGENKILKIEELKKTFANGFQAVKGLNVKMYNGQIFALLGHNGAGKTTTISMLTGLITASKGHCEVFGHDMFEEMDSVRQFLGVCPQHDILFDLLTPEEHLDIFCEFKGVNRKTKKEEIKKMLVDVDVFHHKDTMAKQLSGGNRRKLSVAIALIGGSKLVLLDEPTAGMDLSARRKLWNMLKNQKNNRIIILTTHYMDEADILGDRIGIMAGGQLVCLGSSLFLKNRFGVGYNLTMAKSNKETNTKIGAYLERNLGEVKKLSEVSGEITYQIPMALSGKFKDFFSSFDRDLHSLDIESYGISVTTLEEVFLKVGHGDDTDDDHKAKLQLKESLKEQENQALLNDEYSIADDKNHTVCGTLFQHIWALILKRLYIYKRNYKGLIVEVLVPVLLVLIGFGFSKVQFFIESPDRVLEPSLYPLKQRITVNQQLVKNAYSGTAYDIQPSTLIQYLTDYKDSWEPTYVSYSSITNTSLIIYDYDDDVFESRLNGEYYPYRFGSYFVYEANNKTKNFKVANFLNLTSQDVAAIYPHCMYEAILRSAVGNPNLNLKVVTTPYPITQKLRRRAATSSGIFIVFVVSIGFALIPASVISFILNEREKNVKHMQIISGMSLPAYWISNLFFDTLKGIIPSAIVIGLMYAFELSYDNVFILFLLFPLSVIPFTYVMSFFFTSENIAQTFTIFLHFVFAGIGAIIASILRLIPSTADVGDILCGVFKIIPSFCLTDGIMFAATKSSLFLLRPELQADDLDVTLIGGDILLQMCHFVFWLFVLFLIEMGAFNCFAKILNILKKNQIPQKSSEELKLHPDVLEEEQRVANADKNSLKVRVHKFRKIYPGLFRKPVLAVERTSFGLDYGECFALLGVNGAGKSTTFKSLTCETTPTTGEISIAGYDAQREFSKVRKLIGYCPQHDAIFDLMSVEEHLDYYARIKGIPANLRQDLIEEQIKQMSLQEHRKKPAGTLSGGNKRKLSVAMAIIGNPPIILLDEPSAGMDPEARRFMWSVVARISQHRKKSAVILTTHSMEEAEALSTKMGIQVKGGIFKCFGSSQHIKSEFGKTYEIEVKIRKITAQEVTEYGNTFGFTEEQESVKFEKLSDLLMTRIGDKELHHELIKGGLGNDIVLESEEYDGLVNWKNFVNWVYIEQHGMMIIHALVEEFDEVVILEHYNDYYKLQIQKGTKSIGFAFGFVESRKEEFKISEYSVSQTTLEQIFQVFANQKIDNIEEKKVFKKSDRQLQYSQRNDGPNVKRQYTKQGSKGYE